MSKPKNPITDITTDAAGKLHIEVDEAEFQRQAQEAENFRKEFDKAYKEEVGHDGMPSMAELNNLMAKIF